MYLPRIEKIKTLFSEKKLDAMIVSSVSNIFYLTGISHFSKEEREAYLFITRDNKYFFTTSLYVEEVEKNAQGWIVQTIKRDESFVKLLKAICEKENLATIGFEEQDIRYIEYAWIAQGAKNILPLQLDIRMEKDEEEIARIQQACVLGDKAFASILEHLKPGVTEKEIQTHIELFLKQHHADTSFTPIVAFGQNSSMPHHACSDKRKLEPHECVLIDMGAKMHGYCSDMTRTVFLGKPTDEQKRMYETVLESQKRAISFVETHCNASLHAGDVDTISRNYITSQGYPSIPHSLGHGIGIDVHEPPSLKPKSKTVLRPGMVFSIEPGIYIPNFMGVRIEDLVVIEKTGVKILTLAPREMIVL